MRGHVTGALMGHHLLQRRLELVVARLAQLAHALQLELHRAPVVEQDPLVLRQEARDV